MDSIKRINLQVFISRQIMVMVIRRGGSQDHMRGLRWSIYLLEVAIKLMPPGVERVSIIVDYSGMNPLNNSTPMSITRLWIDTMSQHYPERLSDCFMLNPGLVVWLFFKVIGPLLDPVTRKKVNFVDVDKIKNGECKSKSQEGGVEKSAGFGDYVDVLDFVDAEQLQVEHGGSLEFEFAGKEYWQELEKFLPLPNSD